MLIGYPNRQDSENPIGKLSKIHSLTENLEPSPGRKFAAPDSVWGDMTNRSTHKIDRDSKCLHWMNEIDVGDLKNSGEFALL